MAVIDIIFDVLSGWFPCGSVHGDRILEAYKAANKASRRAPQSADDVNRLIEAMKRTGVPGVYTTPYNARIQVALDAWHRGDDPGELKRMLRAHDRASRAKR